MARCALALALLCAAAAAAGAQSSGYSADPYDGYYKNGTTPTKQAVAAARAALAGVPLRCAIYTILQNNTWFPDNVTYGDGYAYLVGAANSPLVPLLRAGDPNDPASQAGPAAGRGFAVPAAFAQVGGSSVAMLQYVAAQSGANITFDVVRLPYDIYYSSPRNNNTNDTAARVTYLLHELGYDCVAGAVFVYPDRMRFFRYLVPHQPYGFQVVTRIPTWEPEPLFSRLFKFARPFDATLWGVLISSVLVSGLVMMYFEHATGSEDFPVESEPPLVKLARGLHLSAMGITLLEFFKPRTQEGRIYTSIKAFVVVVLMSSYIAQYSAIQNSLPSPVQPISSIDSFAKLGAPVCVRQIAAQQSWVQRNYPGVSVKPVPGLTQVGLLRAIVTGACAGGVGPDTELKFGMGGPYAFDPQGFDPKKTYCGLTTVGNRLNEGSYGIPIRLRDTATLNQSVIDAMNLFVVQAIESGAYGVTAATLFPDPEQRPECTPAAAALEAEVARIKSGQLQLADMAGLFVVQACGMGLAFFVHFARLAAERRAACLGAEGGGGASQERALGRLGSAHDYRISSSKLAAAAVDGGAGHHHEERPHWADADVAGEEEECDEDAALPPGGAAALLVADDAELMRSLEHGGSEARLARLLMRNTAEVDELRRLLHTLTWHVIHGGGHGAHAVHGGGGSMRASHQSPPPAEGAPAEGGGSPGQQAPAAGDSARLPRASALMQQFPSSARIVLRSVPSAPLRMRYTMRLSAQRTRRLPSDAP